MVKVDRTELVARMKEVYSNKLCQLGVPIDPKDRDGRDERICHHCQESYCGISEEELQVMADKFGISSRDLMFGTDEERDARRKANGEI